jgi:hypothetical protein
MDRHISKLQSDKAQESFKLAGDEANQTLKAKNVLQPAFDAWARLRLEAAKQRALAKERAFLRVSRTVATDTDVPKAEWRVQEEYRRRRRQFLRAFKWSKYGQREVFEAWKILRRNADHWSDQVFHTPEKLAAAISWATPPKRFSQTSQTSSAGVTLFHSPGKLSWTSPPKRCSSQTSTPSKTTEMSSAFDEKLVEKSKDAPIGTAFMAQVSGKNLVAELTLMENLYETRIAAAERLLANFVIFHRALKPVSRVWGLSFDLDRSESRLRVASTPAPVPFVETLPPLKTPPGEMAPVMAETLTPRKVPSLDPTGMVSL